MNLLIKNVFGKTTMAKWSAPFPRQGSSPRGYHWPPKPGCVDRFCSCVVWR